MDSMTNEIHTMARENVLCDLELFASFLECVDARPKPSTAWGPISTPDLVCTAFGISPRFSDAKPLPVERLAALDEVLKRYLEDQRVEVQFQVEKITQENQV